MGLGCANDLGQGSTERICSCQSDAGGSARTRLPCPDARRRRVRFAASCPAVRQHCYVAEDPSAPHIERTAPTLDTELAALRDQITKLRSENARLLRLLDLQSLSSIWVRI